MTRIYVRRSVLERLAEYGRREDHGYDHPLLCLIWQLTPDSKGYGKTHTGSKADGDLSEKRVHVAAWEAVHGPVPKGLHIHHLCEVPRCYEPEHLVAVTPAEHRIIHRSEFCRRGLHPMTEAYVRRDGSRYCAACQRERARIRGV